ncbi:MULTISPECIES: hypothetical protein [Limnobacter]|jgi:hypothetical protein|uniref:hypothetical protein n=1 Tax=Limnobacter TaxID=131079 RepID=UPI0023B015F6|nr:hypothetical protein [Limnobacter sp. P1]
MFIKIKGNSVGLSVPLFGTGLNLATIGFISIRPGDNGPTQIFKIQDTMNLKSSSASAIFAMMSTEWTFVDAKQHPWICGAERMLGKTIEIEVIGAMFGAGKADIRISLLDASGKAETLLTRFDVQSKGLQLSDVKVRGKLVHHNGAATLECALK